jgi:3-deoxy-D-manno-octulosonic acid kinase
LKGHTEKRQLARVASGSGAILYDPARTDLPSPAEFSAPQLKSAGRVLGTGQGRGEVCFVAAPGRPGEIAWVLRHYRRGGLVQHFTSDRFLWLGEARTRSFEELKLLAELERRDLPAPRPVAASYTRIGATYRADLLATAIASATSLAQRVRGEVGRELWVEIGACIKRFHIAGVCHADLNAHNVLIDAAGAVHLIDFDRGSLRAAGGWRQGNIARLQRSLLKVSGGRVPDPTAWAALLQGYAGGRPRSVNPR